MELGGLDPPTLLYLGAAALVTAALHSVGGFAGALLMAIAIAPVIGVKATVPIVAAAMIVSHASRAWMFRNAVDWPTFRLIFLPALPFIIAGVIFYVDLPETGVALFLGVMLLISLSLRRVLAGREIAVPRSALAGVAMPYGFLSGASFGVAMMLGPFLLGAGLAGETLIATVAVNGFLLNVIKTAAFGMSPLLTLDYALIGAAMGLCTIPGHHLGRWVLKRTPIRIHTLFLEAFIALGAVYFLYKGIAG
ncbi:MAG: sulfite exporter TauE/SafE family protein [Pseudomonadota bacterium]